MSVQSNTPEDLFIPREVVWYYDDSRLPVNGVALTITQEDSSDIIDLSGTSNVMITDYGLEPNIRTLKPMVIVTKFRQVRKDTMERFLRAKMFGTVTSLQIGVFDTESDTLTPATGLDDYSDYEWFFGLYRGWKSGSVTIYVDGVAKDPTDATYGYTVFEEHGAIQTTTPANWTSVTVTADYTWAPSVKVIKAQPVPIPGVHPQLFDVDVIFKEKEGLSWS